MNEYLIVKWLHVLSSTVLFGTGLGSAYYMFFTSRVARRSGGDARAVAVVARQVVRADAWFTTTTIVFQPLSGLYLAQLALLLFYSAVIAWRLPEFWLHPFGPMLKNLPLAAAIVLLLVLDGAPREERS